jgi:1-aminocyclopropane-1-carboxylate deaminase
MATIQLPEPFASIPRESFLFGLSPIQYLPNITKALGGKVAIYAKREDCNSGLAFGGNKTRKLEYGLLLWVSHISIRIFTQE